MNDNFCNNQHDYEKIGRWVIGEEFLRIPNQYGETPSNDSTGGRLCIS